VSDPYFSLEKLVANPSLIPVQPTFLPSATSTIIPVTDRTGLLNAFDPNFVNPYVQNLTLSVTRNVTSKVTLDLRYIGTLSRKLYSNMDLDTPNFLYNGLKDAFDAARKGGESPLLDRMFQGVTLASFVPGGGSGATQLRNSFLTQSNLANGNYSALATTLNTLTSVESGSQSGSVLRHANTLYPGQFPENFIKTNPQLANAVMETNLGMANYHSFQTQASLRPTAGVSLQATYTFSRNLGMNPGEGPNGTGATFTDPTNRAQDYTLLPSHRRHALVTYGTFALPVGPNKLLFNKASGVWARLVENWQASWIVNMTSGAPMSILAQSMLYGNGVPDVVGPFDTKARDFLWAEGLPTGNLYADAKGAPKYTKVKDPQCLNPNYVAASLALSCTLNAVADSSGRVILQTPLPGKQGTLGRNPIESIGLWTADMSVQKRIQVTEGKSVSVRLDATNVFNHPTPGLAGGFFAAAPGTPDLNLQSFVPFGNFASKVGNRRFQLKARLDF